MALGRQSFRSRIRAAALLAALLALTAGPLTGQTVRGRLVDADTDRPLEGAMITLLGPSGHTLANTLTDALGRFELTAPEAGSYVLRADRIGFSSSVSDTLQLAVADTVEHRMESRFEPVELEGVEITGRKRCEVRPEEGLATARVWEEARKALAAAAWTEEKKGYRYRILEIERQLGPEAVRVRKETRRRLEGFARNPITSRPADELVDQGFVRRLKREDWTYDAPDARVLLSDAFLDTHCMGLRQGEGERSGLIGLRFRPVRGRRTTDIAGTLWLDPATAELQHLDYRYVNLEPLLDGVSLNEHVGGDVNFQRLPNGAWVVRQWRIRMPLVAEQGGPGRFQRATTTPGSRQAQYRTESFLAGLHEVGGMITRVVEDDGRPVFSSGTATLVGTVVDSLGRHPLPDARVHLVGTPDTTSTDANGLFAFSGLSDGAYRVGFSHPRLDSLAHRPEPVEVELTRGQATSVRLRAPPNEEVLAAHCDRQEGFDPGDGVVLVGRFVHERTGKPVPDAILEIHWQQDEIQGQVDLSDVPSEYGRRERDRGRLGWNELMHDPWSGASRAQYWRVRYTDWGARIWPDDNGFYVACRVPTVLPLELVARRGSAVTDTTRMEIPLETKVRRFTVRAPDVGSATLAGIVEDWESGAPVEEARLELEGASFMEWTNSDGQFQMVRVREGRYPLRVVAGEYDAVVDTLELEPGQVRRLRIQIPTEPIPVEGVTVEALSGEERRWRAGGRAEDYAGPEEMTSIAEKVHDMAGALRALGSPRIKVTEFGGNAGAGFCIQGLRPANAAEAARNVPGSCTPMLVVLDGHILQDIPAGAGGGLYTLSTARLNDVDPAEVRSVRVLTPVEARFRYGSRGKYGAVLVETRSGGR